MVHLNPFRKLTQNNIFQPLVCTVAYTFRFSVQTMFSESVNIKKKFKALKCCGTCSSAKPLKHSTVVIRSEHYFKTQKYA